MDNIRNFLEEYQDILWLDGDDYFGDVVCEFDDERKTHFVLNYSGSSDWYWYIDISNENDDIYQLPVYYYDNDTDTSKKESNNFYEFMKKWFDDKIIEMFKK